MQLFVLFYLFIYGKVAKCRTNSCIWSAAAIVTTYSQQVCIDQLLQTQLLLHSNLFIPIVELG